MMRAARDSEEKDFYNRESFGQKFRGGARKPEGEDRDYRDERQRNDFENERAFGEKRNGPEFRQRGTADRQFSKRSSEERDGPYNDRAEMELRDKLMRGPDERFRGENMPKRQQRDKPGFEVGTRGGIPYCFNCNDEGHFSYQCSKPTLCYHCKKTGHKSTICPEKRGLRVCGLGFPGQGFYSLHVSKDKSQARKEILGLMTIERGRADIEIIDKELGYLYCGRRNWKIKQMNDKEFMITFPNEEMRFELTRFKSFEFRTVETQSVVAKVLPTEMSPEATGSLELVWVKALNIPEVARSPEAVTELAFLAGDPKEVDESSIARPSPARINLWCRDSSKIKGGTEVFINGEGHIIEWIVEAPGKSDPPPSSSSNPHPRFDRRKEKDEDDDSGFDRDGNGDGQGERSSNISRMESGTSIIDKSRKYGGGEKQMDCQEVDISQEFNLHQKDNDSLMQIEEGEISSFHNQERNVVPVDSQDKQINGDMNIEQQNEKEDHQVMDLDKEQKAEFIAVISGNEKSIEQVTKNVVDSVEEGEIFDQNENDKEGSVIFSSENSDNREFSQYQDEMVDYDIEPTEEEIEEMKRIEEAFEARTLALAPHMSFNQKPQFNVELKQNDVDAIIDDFFKGKSEKLSTNVSIDKNELEGGKGDLAYATGGLVYEDIQTDDFITVKPRQRVDPIRAERQSKRVQEDGTKMLKKAEDRKTHQLQTSAMEGTIEGGAEAGARWAGAIHQACAGKA